MMIEIEMREDRGGRFYIVKSEKTSMSISIMSTFVSTCVDNGSARAWRAGGKTFHGPDALAKAAYKSAECKAMIEAVQKAEAARQGGKR